MPNPFQAVKLFPKLLYISKLEKFLKEVKPKEGFTFLFRGSIANEPLKPPHIERFHRKEVRRIFSNIRAAGLGKSRKIANVLSSHMQGQGQFGISYTTDPDVALWFARSYAIRRATEQGALHVYEVPLKGVPGLIDIEKAIKTYKPSFTHHQSEIASVFPERLKRYHKTSFVGDFTKYTGTFETELEARTYQAPESSLFKKRYQFKEAVNTIPGIRSSGFYKFNKKSLTGFGSPWDPTVVQLGSRRGLKDLFRKAAELRMSKEDPLLSTWEDSDIERIIEDQRLKTLSGWTPDAPSRPRSRAPTPPVPPPPAPPVSGGTPLPSPAPRRGAGGRPSQSLKGMLSKAAKSKLGIVTAVLAGGYGLYKMFGGEDESRPFKGIMNTINNPVARRDDWISASSLTVRRQDQLISRVSNPAYADIVNRKTDVQQRRMLEATEGGTAQHTQIERELMKSGIAKDTEVYLEDPTNRVFGHMDVLLASGEPMEIKTVESREFDYLKGPKEEHISQINFDMQVLGVQTGKIMYSARGEPGRRKVFDVTANFGTYAQDIARVRSYQEKYGVMGRGQYLSGFRPWESMFGGGVNFNVRSAKIQSQRSRLPAMSQYNRSTTNKVHPNDMGNRVEAMAE